MNEVFYENESQFGIVIGNIRESQSRDEITKKTLKSFHAFYNTTIHLHNAQRLLTTSNKLSQKLRPTHISWYIRNLRSPHL
jgi:hypothetical protein